MDNSETREYVKVGSFKPADEMNEKGAVIERDFYRQGNIFKEKKRILIRSIQIKSAIFQS